MRRVAVLLLLLAGITWAASELPSADAQRPVDPRTQWRRTRNGWEHPTWLTETETTTQFPNVHPGLFALIEFGLVSALFLASGRRGAGRTG